MVFRTSDQNKWFNACLTGRGGKRSDLIYQGNLFCFSICIALYLGLVGGEKHTETTTSPFLSQLLMHVYKMFKETTEIHCLKKQWVPIQQTQKGASRKLGAIQVILGKTLSQRCVDKSSTPYFHWKVVDRLTLFSHLVLLLHFFLAYLYWIGSV